MKIRIKDDKMNLCLRFPTRLIFSKTIARIANSAGQKYASGAMQSIPPEALEAIFAELRRTKDKYGRWELVDIESSKGEMVQIIL